MAHPLKRNCAHAHLHKGESTGEWYGASALVDGTNTPIYRLHAPYRWFLGSTFGSNIGETQAAATHFPINVDVDRLDPGTSGEPIPQSGSGRLPNLPHD